MPLSLLYAKALAEQKTNSRANPRDRLWAAGGGGGPDSSAAGRGLAGGAPAAGSVRPRGGASSFSVNASLGPESPTAFDLGSNRQQEAGVNFDVSYAATEMVNIAAGAEWRNEQYQTAEGHPTSWTVGPYGRGQGFSAGSNGFFGYGPLAAGTWNRSNVAVYGGPVGPAAVAPWRPRRRSPRRFRGAVAEDL